MSELKPLIRAALTLGEAKVAEGLLLGLNYREIGERAGIKEGTVKKYIEHMIWRFKIDVPPEKLPYIVLVGELLASSTAKIPLPAQGSR